MVIVEVEDLFSLRWNPGTVVWNVYDRNRKHLVWPDHDTYISRETFIHSEGLVQEFSVLEESIRKHVAETPHGASLRYAYWAYLKGGIGCLLTDKPCMKNGGFAKKLQWQYTRGDWRHTEGFTLYNHVFWTIARVINAPFSRIPLHCASQELVGAAPMTNLLQLWFQDGAEGVLS